MRATSGTDRDAARERLLAFFDILGPSDLVTHTRKLLTNALF
ncbi:tetratricopeptide repeat protein [Trueperella pyogenes]